MITTLRQTENIKINETKNYSNVDLLEKNTQQNIIDENLEKTQDARLRMKQNLAKLLNYDKYEEVEEQNVQASATVVENETSSYSDEDIRPSSTTMQFGEEGTDTVFQDMHRQREEARSNYHLNKKGKLIVFLYSLTVAVILALIILNTGLLTNLNTTNMAKAQELSEQIEIHNSLVEQSNVATAPETIIDIAENQYNMVLR